MVELPQDTSWGKRAATLGHFVPTNVNHLKSMLQVAPVSADDGVLDIGSGDGNFLKHLASETGCRGIGVEVCPYLHDIARTNCVKEIEEGQLVFFNLPVEELTASGQYVQHGEFEERITLVYIYQVVVNTCPALMKLLAQLLAAGTHIITNTFDLPSEIVAKRIATWPPEVDSAVGMTEVLCGASGDSHSGNFNVYRLHTQLELQAEEEHNRRRHERRIKEERAVRQMQLLVAEHSRVEEESQELELAEHVLHGCQLEVQELEDAIRRHNDMLTDTLAAMEAKDAQTIGEVGESIDALEAVFSSSTLDLKLSHSQEVQRERIGIEHRIQQMRQQLLEKQDEWQQNQAIELKELAAATMQQAEAEAKAIRREAKQGQLWTCLNCDWDTPVSQSVCTMCTSRRGSGLLHWAAHGDWDDQNGSKRVPKDVKEACQAELVAIMEETRSRNEHEREVRIKQRMEIEATVNQKRASALRDVAIKTCSALNEKLQDREQSRRMQVYALDFYRGFLQEMQPARRRDLKAMQLASQARLLEKRQETVTLLARVEELRERQQVAITNFQELVHESTSDHLVNALVNFEKDRLHRRAAKRVARAAREASGEACALSAGAAPLRALTTVA